VNFQACHRIALSAAKEQWQRFSLGEPSDLVVEIVADFCFDRLKRLPRYPWAYIIRVADNKARYEARKERSRRRAKWKMERDYQQKEACTANVEALAVARIELERVICKARIFLSLTEKKVLLRLIDDRTLSSDWNAIRRIRRTLAA
jgi:hypothetical protein